MEFESIFGRSANSVLGTVYGTNFHIFFASWSLFLLFVAAAPFVLKSAGRWAQWLGMFLLTLLLAVVIFTHVSVELRLHEFRGTCLPGQSINLARFS